jgi:hypothetical protein
VATCSVALVPFHAGCKWFSGYVKKVAEAETLGQTAIVVYKKGKVGLRTFDGLGASQLKEVLFLEKHHGYGKSEKQFIEKDAETFAAENTLNRAE